SSVPFSLDTLNSPADLLTSLRGEEVDVSGPASMVGKIVSVVSEPLPPPPPGQAASRTRVTLLTEDGFRQFVLEDAESVKLTDESLEARVGAALDAARLQSAATTRHLTLRSNGEGTRTVDVGYVVATPLWKPSYRVVLPAAGGDKARVQGWAVLENQSATDWKGVDLTLHAGNPVTFHQAIYDVYYANRPDVPVEVLGRILPGADERAIAVNAPPFGGVQHGMLHRFRTENSATGMSAGQAEDAMEAPTPVAARPFTLAAPATETASTETPIDTVFHIATPVDLARGHTANVPILDRQMAAEQVDWLEADSTRPVAALRLTNDGTASLPAGAMTLYTSDPAKGVAFAGDARIGGLPVGESRLLGYAQDLRTTATRNLSAAPKQLLHVTIANGVLHRSTRLRTVYDVTLTAPVKEARRVLVDFAKMPDAKFSVQGGMPQGEEETANAWRVPIDLKAGETRHLTAYADHDVSSEDGLLDDGELNSYLVTLVLSDGNLSPDAQDKLRGLFALRDTVAAKEAALARLNDEKTSIDGDEERIRSNLQVVAGPGDLHGKLLASLDADETRLATLRGEIAAAQQDQDSARKALADAVRGLSL
ncbi:MAG TPA: DUF4139 domain-containing protein, partial [Acetobacteraceae bacterium]|nr:DUF4139 domain-containing protein [Acetobacteraceae bacterium]